MEPQPAGEQMTGSRKLLIVDDEPKLCRVLSQYFSLKGYEVRAVNRGEEALALVPVFQPHVVLLDLLMPGLSGIEVLRQLKQGHPATKVVMLSASDRDDVVRRTLTLGADAYVCKPADLVKLQQVLEGLWAPS